TPLAVFVPGLPELDVPGEDEERGAPGDDEAREAVENPQLEDVGLEELPRRVEHGLEDRRLAARLHVFGADHVREMVDDADLVGEVLVSEVVQVRVDAADRTFGGQLVVRID